MATSTVRQGVPPNVDEAGLNQVLDRLRLVGSEPLPCILRREERDAILSALLSVTALDTDQEALIDAVDAGLDQAGAEEEDRQLQTILAEASHEHEQSVSEHNSRLIDASTDTDPCSQPVGSAPVPASSSREGGPLLCPPTRLGQLSLLARRHAHQCRHLEKIKFKGGAQNVASDQPFAQDRTEHRGNVHSAALRRIVETMGMDRYRQFVGNERNLRFSNSGANIREKTLHEQATSAIITQGRSHDKIKGRQEVYGQIMSNHVLEVV
ncbi:BZ3500_MvSof-1268-A1-R1_Chr8-2g10063 [Microbotryum saponariae]|uniref:BZ3500_MvSof-1268-A1-R1_Chr8-2g10063 protein n=1 Tax=Microbotryum saponariae TaxID=289078 RepID=A0A2X0LBD2_9BASI|nr:BZ3500_MvSof-1268-A1-R1_Chr8-2g10063 [Microbotryum saponariae]SDA01710.1 BZ3501_MvSof-1269-A2-R1_Chr8-2g09813 [Microbotryum saponariae]